VLYVVRDEQGRLLEIATADGQRIYCVPEESTGADAEPEKGQ
jgi:hypothetical protein